MQTHISQRRYQLATLVLDATCESTQSLIAALREPDTEFSLKRSLERTAKMRVLSYRMREEYCDSGYRIHRRAITRQLQLH